MSQAFETALIRKIAWRILPLILVAYCVAYLDRANIAVAALTMNKDLGFSAFTYGLGAGIFFLGYFIFTLSASGPAGGSPGSCSPGASFPRHAPS